MKYIMRRFITSNYSLIFLSFVMEESVALVSCDEPVKPFSDAPIVTSYNDHIQPLLDVVDRLRNLNIMKEGIQLPTIVVIGDQSSGKSSVLESLAGISLPRGQGICTRVPLIMKLQGQNDPKPEIFLEFNGKTVYTDEDHICYDIRLATDEIAGKGKGISKVPLTLVIKKKGVPDLTMVDLPGITRVAIPGQDPNIYQHIAEMIMEFIKPDTSIILNVLSADGDFSTYESISMSKKVDITGERTLAVVTKADKTPEGLLEKVTSNDVAIGLGYVCVRNRIGDESYEDARKEEDSLFQYHPLLFQIDKSMVGIPVLAEKLTEIQATIIAKCFPEIVRKINEKLNYSIAELNKMPRSLSTVPEALSAFTQITSSVKDILRKLLIQGDYEDYPDDNKMHATARLAEMLDCFFNEIQESSEWDSTEKFLMNEIKVLEEVNCIGLPNFLPRTAFHVILQGNMKKIASKPITFVEKVFDYIEEVMSTVVIQHTTNYPQTQPPTKRAIRNLLAKLKELLLEQIEECIEKEKSSDYTCDPSYLSGWNDLILSQATFKACVLSGYSSVNIEGFGKVDAGHLKDYAHFLPSAYDLKMRMFSYWKIVVRRMVDSLALDLQFAIKNLVNKKIEIEIFKEVMGPSGSGVEMMLVEEPITASKRSRLNKSIDLLKESKDAVANVIDKVIITRD